MHIVHVFVSVKPENVAAFIAATTKNAQESVLEPGIARFDVVQQKDDPTKFVLVEAYRSEDDPAKHKATTHYAEWRDTVAPMMAEPRKSIVYTECYPDALAW